MNAARLTITEVDVLLAGLAAVTEPIDIDFLWRPQLRDPGDEMVLEAAVNGHADWLITFNTRHLATVPIGSASVAIDLVPYCNSIRSFAHEKSQFRPASAALADGRTPPGRRTG